ncbi:MAG TPA: protein kinase [Bryobacteraceae bacterium]|nr:protein kinase [Bryobacteraceae bacterium]
MVWIAGVYACRNRSWKAFQKELCVLLEACIEQDERFFVVSFRDSLGFVQFRSELAGDLIGEAVSNDYLTVEKQLGEATIQRLEALGWRKRGNYRRRNFSQRWASPVDLTKVAALAVKTLDDGYGGSSPLNLEITLGSFHGADHSHSKVTLMSDNPDLQLPSGLTVQNGSNGNAYRVRMPLGAGGFGAVYRVTPLSETIPTACVLKVSLDATAWTREAYFGELLKRDPAVVRMYESFPWTPPGGSQPLCCLIFELMRGGDVQQYLRRQPQPWKESKARCEVIRLLRAVNLLHQCGAVHRDLTPKNILVTAARRLKIADFGIAAQSLAPSGVAADAFNLAYAPPAVSAGDAKHWSPADDVFHIGKLFAMLLSGSSSWPTKMDVKNLICSTDAKEIIQRCIGEKHKRFQNAGELLAFLQRKTAMPHALPVSTLLGKRVVFTGRMDITRKEARLRVKKCGGKCQGQVSHTTDVIVVGRYASSLWLAERKGKKLLDVDREWGLGHHIAVLSEKRFLKLVGA